MTDLDLALQLADTADEITTAAFRRVDLVVETKADRTPVTSADREVEETLREMLAGEEVLGEEFGSSGAGGGRRWIVDPIDGTKNFVRRVPAWATLIALQERGVVTVGVVSAPALGRRWWASKGLGAWANGEPIHVSRVSRLEDAHLSGNALSSWPNGPSRYAELALRCYADRAFGDFWSHVLVAEGACDIGIDPVASLWDLAPVQIIVEEAGGRFTDLEGNSTPGGGSGISTNGLLHDEVLAVLGGC